MCGAVLLERYLLGNASLQVLSCRVLSDRAHKMPLTDGCGAHVLYWLRWSVSCGRFVGQAAAIRKLWTGCSSSHRTFSRFNGQEALRRNLAAWLCFEGMSYGLFPNKQGQTYVEIEVVPHLNPKQLLAAADLASADQGRGREGPEVPRGHCETGTGSDGRCLPGSHRPGAAKPLFCLCYQPSQKLRSAVLLLGREFQISFIKPNLSLAEKTRSDSD